MIPSARIRPKLESSFRLAHLARVLEPSLAAPITLDQIRAGRGLPRWTQGVLASRAAVSVVTLNMIESEQVQPRSRTLEAIRRVLEGGGIRFIGDADTGYGVLLRPRAETGPRSRSTETAL